MHPLLEQGLHQRVFWITRRIAIGQFATEQRAEWLLEQGVTHILNVGEGPSVVTATEAGFRDVLDVSIEDLTQIPDDLAIRCLGIIHDVMLQPDTRLATPTVLVVVRLINGDLSTRVDIARTHDI